VTGLPRIPLFDVDYDEREEAAVLEVLRSKWLTMGERTLAFESAFAAMIDAAHCVAVSSCTAALHLAVRALGIGPGDEVIVPDLTFVATASAVLLEGAAVVLADIVGENDLTLDPADVEAKITERTKAVIVMHYAGYPCHMAEIMALAEKHGLQVIEDCAHAPGARYEGRSVGTIGDLGCFSFFSNKNVATGEGGMLVTDDAALAESARLMRSHCMTAQTLDRHKGHAWGYDVVGVGLNYRMTEIEAALGLVQLGKLAAGNAARGRCVSRYRETLSQIRDLKVPFAGFDDGDWVFAGTSAHHIMPILLPESTPRRDLAAQLTKRGVQTSVHYRPLHSLSNPALLGRAEGWTPMLDRLAGRLLSLPLWPSMTNAAITDVCETLRAQLP
jgi:dTDP-4-amino-4,6-dideoxygalactose transaminase